MNITNNVKIGYKDYKVNMKDHDIYVRGKECYGEINYDEETISIGCKFNENQIKATFIHEIVHGIDDMYGADLKEKQVEMLGNGLYKFIIDNPDIFK
jgi:hypothetical protein